MKRIFIPSKSKYKFNKDSFFKISKSLPNRIAIVYSIQYESLAIEINRLLKNSHKITSFFQVLGCSKVKFSKETQGILLIGSGKFHALSLASISNLPIYIYENEKITKISEIEIEKFNKMKKGAYIKFLNSKNTGVLISLKPGQQNFSRAFKLKERLKDKKIYFFIGDFLSSQELENFEIDSWINTACPRLDMENSAILNISDLELIKH
jgi:diphthamide biosynthesis enzyme Dph1/Dph2-like protein